MILLLFPSFLISVSYIDIIAVSNDLKTEKKRKMFSGKMDFFVENSEISPVCSQKRKSENCFRYSTIVCIFDSYRTL